MNDRNTLAKTLQEHLIGYLRALRQDLVISVTSVRLDVVWSVPRR
jgi:hypothetical protein